MDWFPQFIIWWTIVSNIWHLPILAYTRVTVPQSGSVSERDRSNVISKWNMLRKECCRDDELIWDLNHAAHPTWKWIYTNTIYDPRISFNMRNCVNISSRPMIQYDRYIYDHVCLSFVFDDVFIWYPCDGLITTFKNKFVNIATRFSMFRGASLY
jgi:hypothetical protein